MRLLQITNSCWTWVTPSWHNCLHAFQGTFERRKVIRAPMALPWGQSWKSKVSKGGGSERGPPSGGGGGGGEPGCPLHSRAGVGHTGPGQPWAGCGVGRAALPCPCGVRAWRPFLSPSWGGWGQPVPSPDPNPTSCVTEKPHIIKVFQILFLEWFKIFLVILDVSFMESLCVYTWVCAYTGVQV